MGKSRQMAMQISCGQLRSILMGCDSLEDPHYSGITAKRNKDLQHRAAFAAVYAAVEGNRSVFDIAKVVLWRNGEGQPLVPEVEWFRTAPKKHGKLTA